MNVLSQMLQSLGEKTITNRTVQGNWLITEYADGYVEQEYIRTDASFTITTAKGSNYGTSSNSTITYPIPLQTVTSGNIQVSITSYEVWPILMNINATSISYRVMSFASRSQTSGYKVTAKICGYK